MKIVQEEISPFSGRRIIKVEFQLSEETIQDLKGEIPLDDLVLHLGSDLIQALKERYGKRG